MKSIGAGPGPEQIPITAYKQDETTIRERLGPARGAITPEGLPVAQGMRASEHRTAARREALSEKKQAGRSEASQGAGGKAESA